MGTGTAHPFCKGMLQWQFTYCALHMDTFLFGLLRWTSFCADTTSVTGFLSCYNTSYTFNCIHEWSDLKNAGLPGDQHQIFFFFYKYFDSFLTSFKSFWWLAHQLVKQNATAKGGRNVKFHIDANGTTSDSPSLTNWNGNHQKFSESCQRLSKS